MKAMEEQEGGIKNFALGHKTFGPQVIILLEIFVFKKETDFPSF